MKVQLPTKGNGFDPMPYHTEWGIVGEIHPDTPLIYLATLPEGYQFTAPSNYHAYLIDDQGRTLCTIFEDTFALLNRVGDWKSRFFVKTIHHQKK